MKRILVITDEDVGLKSEKNSEEPRTAARAIVWKKDLVALLHVGKHNYYKLPGGGVEAGETIRQGLDREVLEETGCKIRVKNEVGEIIEHRSHNGIVQTSHCFTAKVIEEGKPGFTQEEIAGGFELVWVSLEEAIRLVRNGSPTTYDGKFIVKRDLEFLKAAEKLIRANEV